MGSLRGHWEATGVVSVGLKHHQRYTGRLRSADLSRSLLGTETKICHKGRQAGRRGWAQAPSQRERLAVLMKT